MSRWRAVVAVAAAISLVTLLAAGADASVSRSAATFDPTCGKARAADRTVDGTLGSVTLHGTPKRIVALEFSFVDDLVAVGLKPVGIADDNNPNSIIPPIRAKVAGYTSVGLRATPNLETIASLHPDLIIADATRDAKIMNKLNAIAPTIALDSLQQAYLPNLHSAIVIGQLVNKCGAMRVRVQQDKLIMARIAKVVPKSYASKRAMFVVSDKTVFNVHSSLAYTPSLLKAIGIGEANIVKPAKGANPYIVMSLEDLVSNNPDIMFVADYFPGTAVIDGYQKSPLWGTVTAAKNKQVYNVNPALWSKARGLLAGELIAQQAVHLLFHKFVSIALPKVTSA
ncbi:MAG TPA: Fe(3+) dicitrate ABC transporter substrate-binding protein [Gaiellaceae bacterium]|jgi:iron complex transport system substrate-binding protein|nr:Fe(3+) dicitrate ABC transporter substrate-binding protein [Gaiellaceae bacterium]